MASLGKSFNPYKDLKEEFVSNLEGSSMFEVGVLIGSIATLTVVRQLISYFVVTGSYRILGSRNWRTYITAIVVDFLIIVFPLILFLTILSEWLHVVAMLLALLLYFIVKSFGFTGEEPHLLRKNISSYRVFVMIIACVSILAVDFKIFPRRFAKTETYGTSMMDLGVGSFVLVNSMVSRQARNVHMVNWMTALRSTSPLIILGFVRLVTTTGVNYQVHVGEYGVHWNFFFTLAAISILTSLINCPAKYCGIFGSLVLIGYQICLVRGLNHYLLSNTRGMDYISQNKEGIFSLFGYWGMYLLGVRLGNYLFFQTHSTASWARTRAWCLALLFWVLTVFLDRYFERISRRTCNLAYVTFLIASNIQALAIIMLSDYIPGSKISVLEEAFNVNMLAVFLVANLLTGFVNLSMNTLSVTTGTALGILIVYGLIVSLITGIIHFCGFKLKFW